MKADPKKIARQYLKAATSGDLDTLKNLLTPEVTLWIPQSTTGPRSTRNPITGRDAVLAVLSDVATGVFNSSSSTLDFHHEISEGDFVVVHFTLRTKTARGAAYHNSYMILFRFEDGRITESWEQTDTAYAFAKFEE